ncbi:FMN-linked oxidoreductase [Choiromyces venosus 120613-1]|uniref:Dihydroorotate oxidase n=1 Tax=Choiromyces venosus 120613-1 TaxID=1336337 RepID=A0A3N4JQN8_9PEZI|nr:FMN-linked oxidoreductase [Choiromyces venosus 120613-1]
MPRVTFRPPLFNSSSPWATTKIDLQDLYNSPFTGAVTTRTSLPAGFPHNPSIHQHTLFDSPTTSLNTYGYSPHPLKFYLDTVKSIITDSGKPQTKPFIISVTGTPEEVAEAVAAVDDVAKEGYNLLVELNLSCPNIPDKPPPAYSLPELRAYLDLLSKLKAEVLIGLKTPPYTYDAQFQVLLSALKAYPSLISFVTSTNTLGSSLHLSSPPSLAVSEGRRVVYQPTLSSPAGTGVGGLGGASIHWLSLGNVSTIRRMLNQVPELKDIAIIGVGGVSDRDGWERMLSVGAESVGVATALGKNGVGVFANISGEN